MADKAAVAVAKRLKREGRLSKEFGDIYPVSELISDAYKPLVKAIRNWIGSGPTCGKGTCI